jgi:hypothetical protein
MKRIILVLSLAFASIAFGQNYEQSSFVGEWNGTIESEWNNYKDNITLELKEDGTYYDHSGRLMPSIYPDTQRWEYEAETNRLHLWYLQTVYAGMKTYTHIYYEVVNFNETYLELHYNFWDDPEPNPDATKLVLTMEPTSVEDTPLVNVDRELIRVTDITGREVNERTVGIPLIFQYNDGSIEKRITK